MASRSTPRFIACRATTSRALPTGRPGSGARVRRAASPALRRAAGLLGVDEVWAIGGAQALAAMAHGVVDEGEDRRDVLEPVHTITGPGNLFVATAKRQLRSVVGVDAEAGTTEIAVLADDSTIGKALPFNRACSTSTEHVQPGLALLPTGKEADPVHTF